MKKQHKILCITSLITITDYGIEYKISGEKNKE